MAVDTAAPLPIPRAIGTVASTVIVRSGSPIDVIGPQRQPDDPRQRIVVAASRTASRRSRSGASITTPCPSRAGSTVARACTSVTGTAIAGRP